MMGISGYSLLKLWVKSYEIEFICFHKFCFFITYVYVQEKNKQSKGYTNEGRNGTNIYYLEQERKFIH